MLHIGGVYMYIYIYATYRRCIYIYIYATHIYIYTYATYRRWPSAGEMGIRIRRKWISAPDAHPERKSSPAPEMMPGEIGCASGLDSERK